MIFRDITTEKMRVALSFIKVIIYRKVYNRTIFIINPVLRTFCRKNGCSTEKMNCPPETNQSATFFANFSKSSI